MLTLSVKRFGFAAGATAALLYLGCIFVMSTVPHEAVIAIFNNLLHGWEVSQMMRWEMPWWEAILGLPETFILGGLVGSIFATLYNLGAPRKE